MQKYLIGSRIVSGEEYRKYRIDKGLIKENKKEEFKINETLEKKDDIVSDEMDNELVELHKQYEDKTGKKISNRYKFDKDWIKSKLS